MIDKFINVLLIYLPNNVFMNKHLMKILILYGVTNKSVSMDKEHSCPVVKSENESFSSLMSPNLSFGSDLTEDAKKHENTSEYRNISLVNSFASLNELSDNFVEIKNWNNIVANLDLNLINSRGLDNECIESLNSLTDEKIDLLKILSDKKNVFTKYNQSVFIKLNELDSEEREFIKNLNLENDYNYSKNKFGYNDVTIFDGKVKVKEVCDEIIENCLYLKPISDDMFKDIDDLVVNFYSKQVWSDVENNAIKNLINGSLFFEDFERITNAYYLSENFKETRLSDVQEVTLDQIVEVAKNLNFEGLVDIKDVRNIKLYTKDLQESEELLDYYKYISFSYIENLCFDESKNEEKIFFISKMKELDLIDDSLIDEEKLYMYIKEEIDLIKNKNKVFENKQNILYENHFENDVNIGEEIYDDYVISSVFERFITGRSLYENLFGEKKTNESLLCHIHSEVFKEKFELFIEKRFSELKNNNIKYDKDYLKSLLNFDVLKLFIVDKITQKTSEKELNLADLNDFIKSIKSNALYKCKYKFILEKFKTTNIISKMEKTINKIESQKNKINDLNEFENKNMQIIWKNFMNIFLNVLMDKTLDELSPKILNFNNLVLTYLKYNLAKSIDDLHKYFKLLKNDCNNVNFNNVRVTLKNINHYDKCFLISNDLIDMYNHKNEEEFSNINEILQDNRCKFKEAISFLVPLISHKIEIEKENKEKDFMKEYIFSNKENALNFEFQFNKL